MLQFFQDTDEPDPDGDVVINSGEIDDLYNVINMIDFSSGVGKIRFRLVTSGPATTNYYQAWWDFIAIQPNPPLQPCWVAQAVYGASNPRWMLFRTWLDRHAPRNCTRPTWASAVPLRRGSSPRRWHSRFCGRSSMRRSGSSAVPRSMSRSAASVGPMPHGA